MLEIMKTAADNVVELYSDGMRISGKSDIGFMTHLCNHLNKRISTLSTEIRILKEMKIKVITEHKEDEEYEAKQTLTRLIKVIENQKRKLN